MAQGVEPTKRNIVSLVGRIYDPLGFLSPVVVQFKSLFQELCGSKLGWYQPITGELLRKWNLLTMDLQGSAPILIPRYLLYNVSNEVESYSLHGFCDASLESICSGGLLASQDPYWVQCDLLGLQDET